MPARFPNVRSCGFLRTPLPDWRLSRAESVTIVSFPQAGVEIGFIRVSCGSNDSWSYAILMISPPPSKGRSGGGWGVRGQASGVRSQESGIRTKQLHPIPTLALPLKILWCVSSFLQSLWIKVRLVSVDRPSGAGDVTSKHDQGFNARQTARQSSLVQRSPCTSS